MPTDSHWRAFGKVYRIAGCMPLNGTYCGAVADIEPTMRRENQRLVGVYTCESVNLPYALIETGQLATSR